ncbi:MAG: CDP-alcohol phosphatidyltransferase family protein, partial [Alphaproteobacteria bacterium]|nr:CDP-alcohol phosphatidyltransferase family protein [Alphaproteobacteria bacterium]
MLTSLPNLLTLSRIVVIPALVATFFFKGDWADWTALGLFALAGFTDWLDGYIARAQGLVSN